MNVVVILGFGETGWGMKEERLFGGVMKPNVGESDGEDRDIARGIPECEESLLVLDDGGVMV